MKLAQVKFLAKQMEMDASLTLYIQCKENSFFHEVIKFDFESNQVICLEARTMINFERPKIFVSIDSIFDAFWSIEKEIPIWIEK